MGPLQAIIRGQRRVTLEGVREVIATALIDQHAATLRDDPLYLDRCQVDTPDHLVKLAWAQVRTRRRLVGKVVDFGAGDARFARGGSFDSYLGYEVDARRFASAPRSETVQLVDRCAFSHVDADADLCIGNPPYVRNQDLPIGWRQMAADEVRCRTGVSLSGLANAWQYFLMLGLSSVDADGLIVQIVPYEWVSRPAVAPIRQYIEHNRWNVDVYRLPDRVFREVLTAASITVIDKGRTGRRWRYHELGTGGRAKALPSPTTARPGVIAYSATPHDGPRAKRGLSPGTQKVLTLTEGERAHAGLRIGSDVVRCVTSLRHLPGELTQLSAEAFNIYYRSFGAKCWLIRTDKEPSERLRAYLDSVDRDDYQTATCLSRGQWWKFTMPVDKPQLLVAQAFKGAAPKMVVNEAMAFPVGGVAGIYDLAKDDVHCALQKLSALDLRDRLVPYAKSLHKLEINQLNTLLSTIVDPSGLSDE